eukprot:142092-Chlamydomonas_euryale.AAC.3
MSATGMLQRLLPCQPVCQIPPLTCIVLYIDRCSVALYVKSPWQFMGAPPSPHPHAACSLYRPLVLIAALWPCTSNRLGNSWAAPPSSTPMQRALCINLALQTQRTFKTKSL